MTKHNPTTDLPSPPPLARTRRAAHFALVTACIGGTLAAPMNYAANGKKLVEPALVPTVNPTLLPTSAIQSPLRLTADKTSVWRPGTDQRVFLEGNVVVEVGYRVMRAPQAVAWLTPSAESGAGTYDVAIYLSSGENAGDVVRVEESTITGGTVSVSKELIVTTRVTQSALLTGTPQPMGREAYTKFEKENTVFARGESLRQDLLTKRPPLAYIPIVQFTDAEYALQNGWIARGAGNLLIPGPADTALARGGSGSGATTRDRAVGVGPKSPAKEKPKPQVLAVVDRASSYLMPGGREQVTVANNLFLMVDQRNNRPPMELKAENAVFFSPADAAKKAMGVAETKPATATAPAASDKPEKLPGLSTGDVARYATGVYLEGDVTLVSGSTTIRATRLYYDFTSGRAIMLDATLSAVDDARNIPLYMRAKEIRQLSATDFVARDVKFSTSEFYTPHYHIGASNVYLQEVPLGGEPGEGLGGRSFDYGFENATLNAQGVPIFWWPYFAGNTDKQPLPIRAIKVGSSQQYGPFIQTDWDLLALLGQTAPQGVSVDLQLDYLGSHGPGGGVNAKYEFESMFGLLKTYGIFDTGTDRLGRDPARKDLPLEQSARGRLLFQHQQELDDKWTLEIEGSYISDPNFLANYFQSEYERNKAPETSIYLKRQGQTDALTFYGKWSLYDFTASADQVDDQYSTDKSPEIKYFRIGDSVLDVFTYYSETSVGAVHTKITDYSPSFSGLQNLFAQDYFAVYGADLSKLSSVTLRNFLKNAGWQTDTVLRADTRQELDLPLALGDVKIVPYVTGRLTFWDDAFPESEDGTTTRVYGGGGIRASTQFWKVYDDAESIFWDVHRIRHIIEPSINIFGAGANQNRNDLQPFDRGVEGISTASGVNVGISQRWQTKRGGPDNARTTDWIVLNINWSYFWNQDDPGMFFSQPPLRGYFFTSRPELSQAANAVNIDGSWRIGERVRLMANMNINTDSSTVQQAAAGIAIDQSPQLTYFLGTRYITGLDAYEPFSEGGNFAINTPGASTSNEITFAIDYKITRKYEIIFSETFDTEISRNITTSFTLIRRFPRLYGAFTVSYDANNSDTSVVVSVWPEGFPEMSPITNNPTRNIGAGR